MSELQNFLSPVIMGLCFLIGNSIKTSFPKIPNNYIPSILALIGAVLMVVLEGNSGQNIVIGIVSGLSATGLHQVHKGIIKEDQKTN